MRRPTAIYRRFLASTRGVAAIEFGLVFPMLLVMLLASIDAGRAIAVYMKVRAATYALDSMANQYTKIQDTDLQNIEGASSKVLAPYPGGPLGLRISQIEVTTGGPVVAWSDGQNMSPYAKGDTITIPSNLAGTSAPNNACPASPPSADLYTTGNVNGKGCYLLLAEVQYTYTPMFGAFITGPITLSDKIYVTPRNSICVTRNSGCYYP
jgi:Flp pilus assembly protein TadG